jgi:hypothetical protein
MHISNYEQVNPQTQHLIFNVFTSICHHYDYLYDNLLHNCTFQASTFFKEADAEKKNNRKSINSMYTQACNSESSWKTVYNTMVNKKNTLRNAIEDST